MPVIDRACNKTCRMIKYFRFVFIMCCGAQRWHRVSLHTLSSCGPPCHRCALPSQAMNYGCYSRASAPAGKMLFLIIPAQTGSDCLVCKNSL